MVSSLQGREDGVAAPIDNMQDQTCPREGGHSQPAPFPHGWVFFAPLPGKAIWKGEHRTPRR